MELWTSAAIQAKVRLDLDLEDELFIGPAELLGYINDGISDAEAHIHTLYEDYFLTSTPIELEEGTAEYALPEDIYANKIRAFNYDGGSSSTKYEIKRWRKPLSLLPFVNSNDDYQYIPINTSEDGYQLKLLPAAREDSETAATLWYLRGALTLVDDDDACDIPEFINYIIWYAKVRCLAKEGNPALSGAQAYLEYLLQLMITTLANMTDDENTEVPADLSFYSDFDSSIYW